MACNLIWSSGQRYSPVTVMWIVLMGIVGFEMPVVVCVAPANISYTCNATGVDKILGVSQLNIRLLNQQKTIMCTTDTIGVIHCPQNITNQKAMYVFYEEENVGSFIGGQNVKIYKLTCNDTYRATKNLQFTSNQDPSNSENENIPIPHDISLKIMQNNIATTEVTLGERLVLDISGTEEAKLYITPIYCDAKSTDEHQHVRLWEMNSTNIGNNNGCQTTQGITEQRWKRSEPKSIQLGFYAFRFVGGNAVTIECSAYVCSETENKECAQTCVDTEHTIRRRRRSNAIETRKSVARHATASFRVVSIEDEHNSSQGLIVLSYTLYLIMVSVALIMKRSR